jgi:diacylglycerol kinase (ATP)
MALLTPVSLCLHVGRLEHLLLILSMLLVVLVEFLNSAVESAVDRISTDPHPLSGQAKDLGSAAVLIALIMWALTWGVIAGPLAQAPWRWACCADAESPGMRPTNQSCVR